MSLKTKELTLSLLAAFVVRGGVFAAGPEGTALLGKDSFKELYIELQAPVERVSAKAEAKGILESGVFDLYVGDSYRGREKLERKEQLSRYECAAQELEFLEEIFKDSGYNLRNAAEKIRAINGAPIPLFISNKIKEKGLFKKVTTGGEFFSEDGSIRLYCSAFSFMGGTSYEVGEMASSLMHELGHMLMFRSYGGAWPKGKAADAWMEGFARFFSLALSGSYEAKCSLQHDKHCPHGVTALFKGEGSTRENCYYTMGFIEKRDFFETVPKACGRMWKLYHAPWREKILEEDFVFAVLAQLASFRSKENKWWVDADKVNRLLQPVFQSRRDLPGSLHLDFEEYLRHYIRLFPEEKERVQAVVRGLSGKAVLPDWLAGNF